MHSCGHQIRQQPVMRVPFCVWDVGCTTANWRSHFNQLTNRSVRFNSCSYASLPGETTSVFIHFKSPCRSKKPKVSSQVSSQKKCTPKFPGRVWYRTVSVCCMINTERQACEVQRLLLQFLAECMTSNNASTWSVTSTKEKREEVHWRLPINFYGLWRNSSVDAFHKFLCITQYRSVFSRSWHLFWRTFLQKWIAKEDHICTRRSKSNYYA